MMWWLLSTLTYVFASDEIKHLPGLNYDINFKQYSGYLDASETRKFHYWFVESQNDPSTDPLIVWFNGGPGCSSLLGMLQELGPFLIQADGKTLQKNEYSWNNNASVLFIESPAGVGFSYSTDGSSLNSDNLTSLHNYQVIKQFFNKYPRFRKNDMFITGESYAGVYIPTLAARIIDGQKDFDINLKGIAIGNGAVSEKLQGETSSLFFYYHGVVDEDQWKTILDCCEGVDNCNYKECGTFDRVADNLYDLHSKCSSNRGAQIQQMMRSSEAREQFRELMIRKSLNFLPKTPENTSIECVPHSSLEKYLNSPEVQKALHVTLKEEKWEMCNMLVNMLYQETEREQFDYVKKIAENNIRTLLYYGDTDTVCNFMIGQKFSYQLRLKKIADKTAWFYDNKIVGGYKTVYENLTFLTINGAGHMVPQTHPRQMQHVLQQFIKGETI